MLKQARGTFQMAALPWTKRGEFINRELGINLTEFRADMLDWRSNKWSDSPPRPASNWRQYLLYYQYSATADSAQGTEWQVCRTIPTLEFLRYDGGIYTIDSEGRIKLNNGTGFSGAKTIGYNPYFLIEYSIASDKNGILIDNVQDAIDALAAAIARLGSGIRNIMDADKGEMNNMLLCGTVTTAKWLSPGKQEWTSTFSKPQLPMNSAIFGSKHDIFRGDSLLIAGRGNIIGNGNRTETACSLIVGLDNEVLCDKEANPEEGLAYNLTSSILSGQYNKTVGLVPGVIIGGEGNLVADTGLSLVAGTGNVLTDGSWHSAIFGAGNFICNGSVQSFIAGSANKITGNPDNAEEGSVNSAVFGAGNIIANRSVQSFIAGSGNRIADGSVQSAIFGTGNIIANFSVQSFIAGSGNRIAGGSVNSSIFGAGNGIYANSAMSFIGGAGNVIAESPHSAVFGTGNHISNGSVQSFIAGNANSIALYSDCSAAFGRDCIISDSKQSFAAGLGNRISTWSHLSFAGGLNNRISDWSVQSAAFGAENVIANSSSASFAAGVSNRITDNSVHSAVFGAGNGIANGSTGSFIAGEGNRVTYHSVFSAVFGAGNEIANASMQSFIAGTGNLIATGSVHSAIFGAGNKITETSSQSFTAGGGNLITQSEAAAIFGRDCKIAGNSGYSLISGCNNSIEGSSYYSFISGYFNRIDDYSYYSSILGGYDSSIASGSGYSSILGGSYNTIADYSYYSSILGGYGNIISGSSTYSAIVGGSYNTVGNARYAAILGGYGLKAPADYFAVTDRLAIDSRMLLLGDGTDSPPNESDVLMVESVETLSAANGGTIAVPRVKWSGALADLQMQVSAGRGQGGALDYYDFGKPTGQVTMQEFLAYAMPNIWGAGGVFTYNAGTPSQSTYTLNGNTNYAADIFSATWVHNAFDNHMLQLVNTPDTNPPIFEIVDIGQSIVGQATNSLLGIVKGSTANMKVSVDIAGEMSVNGLDAALGSKAPANISLNADTGTGTDIATPAVASSTIQSVVQTVWAKIRQVANALSVKQDKLIAGTNITISGNEISATGGTIPPSALGVPVKAIIASSVNGFTPSKDTYYYIYNHPSINGEYRVNAYSMTGLTNADIGKIYTFMSNCGTGTTRVYYYGNSTDYYSETVGEEMPPNSMSFSQSNPVRLMFVGFRATNNFNNYPRFLPV
jgi:hypothetical protein